MRWSSASVLSTLTWSAGVGSGGVVSAGAGSAFWSSRSRSAASRWRPTVIERKCASAPGTTIHGARAVEVWCRKGSQTSTKRSYCLK
jgi:hypothetical protein